MEILHSTHKLRPRALSESKDPFYGKPGHRSALGSYISLNSIPSQTEAVIRRGVTVKALTLLMQHVKDQNVSHPTSVMIKRTVKGKFTYRTLYSRNQIVRTPVKLLAEKIFKMVKKRRKYLHLLIKPSQQGGKIHEIISSNLTLL